MKDGGVICQNIDPGSAATDWKTQWLAAAQDSRVVNFVTEGKKIIGVGKNYREHVKELAAGDNPLWICVYTEDGFQAWSSPVFVFR